MTNSTIVPQQPPTPRPLGPQWARVYRRNPACPSDDKPCAECGHLTTCRRCVRMRALVCTVRRAS